MAASSWKAGGSPWYHQRHRHLSWLESSVHRKWGVTALACWTLSWHPNEVWDSSQTGGLWMETRPGGNNAAAQPSLSLPERRPAGRRLPVCARVSCQTLFLGAKSTLLAAGEVSSPRECSLAPEEASCGGIRLPER